MQPLPCETKGGPDTGRPYSGGLPRITSRGPSLRRLNLPASGAVQQDGAIIYPAAEARISGG